MSIDITEQRLKMRAHGYSPIPLNGKAPTARGGRSSATPPTMRSPPGLACVPPRQTPGH